MKLWYDDDVRYKIGSNNTFRKVRTEKNGEI